MTKLYCENQPIYDEQRQMCVDPALSPEFGIENSMSMLETPLSSDLTSETPLLDLQQEEQRPELQTPGIMRGIEAAYNTEDPVYRNLSITQLYGAVSHQMDDAIFSDPSDRKQQANWLTFATWASNEAGRAIRDEAAPNMTGLGRLVGQGDEIDASTEALAEGNKVVFAEIAPVAAMFAHNMGGDTEFDAEKLDVFMEWMQEEAPNQDAELGNQNLQDAFRLYYQAKFEEDADAQAEMMLHANVLVGMHEQTRLQPYIETGMPMMREFVTDVALGLNVPRSDQSGPVGLEDMSRYQELDMGDAVPHPDYRPGGSPYAPGLETIEDPALDAALRRFDPNLNDLESSEPDDWTNYDDRMDYIANLFRTRQDDSAMFRQPFTMQQKNEKYERHNNNGETLAESRRREEIRQYHHECMLSCHGGGKAPTFPGLESPSMHDDPVWSQDPMRSNGSPFSGLPGMQEPQTMNDEEVQRIVDYIRSLDGPEGDGSGAAQQ